MVHAALEIKGLAELKDALGKLVPELKGEATAIVLDAAHAAKDDIVAQYPTGPGKKGKSGGNLKKGVRVKIEEIGPHGVAAKVRSTAPHGWLYEHGSEARHYISTYGKRHNTGAMWGKRPLTPVFIPTMIRHRRAMYQKLVALIARTGLTVKVDEAA